jgi:asparagine synthase (glutamine-hydrolysing)
MAPLQRLGIAGEVSHEGILSYFRWGGVEAPRTMFSKVNLLPPGALARWSGGEVKVERYFQPQWQGRAGWIRSSEALCREVRDRVIESVEAHLESDVPVGVFLSGGLDSNIVCAALRELSVSRLQAFSVGYDGQQGIEDESETARRSAEFFGAKCVIERVSAASLLETFDHFISHLDSPSGDALNTYLVSRTASRHVKVALSGLGADEWFAGYNYFLLAKAARALPFWRLIGAARLQETVRNWFANVPARLRGKRLAKLAALTVGAMGTTLPEWYRAFYAVLSPEEMDLLISPKLCARGAGTPVHEPDWREIEAELEQRASDSWVNVLNLLETEHHLPNVLLRDCDAMSMAHSLELRTPLVDREIFHLAGQVPPEMKLHGGINKWALREAFRPLLPPWINEDRKKKTFTLPLMTWLREPGWRDRVHDTLLSKRCIDRGWLEPRRVRAHLEEFYGSSERGRGGFGLSQRVWLMLVLESWAQSHIDHAQP